ncbi:nucleoside triphosphate pyrophosphohydrolase [Bacillus sp. 2205SS5-2]|uniref:nucleoside triphosphate pyrophosphohydrolase n=1 Tax=Bacillus sp. 2205SS5-2 TaxID=3109031 RepID=UPI0030057D58
MPTYNKLVRDKIPQIIKESGKSCTTSVLSHEDYVIELKKKSREELQEYLETRDEVSALEELADVLEVLYALANMHGASIEDLEKIRQAKAADRGTFDQKLFLMEVRESV